jgi:transcriptional regulator CtsR
MNTYQKEILTSAFEGRTKEVTEYQVNIDNFRLAIERIGDDVELQEFKQQLQVLLSSSVLEQRKAQIMLDVIRLQLESSGQ